MSSNNLQGNYNEYIILDAGSAKAINISDYTVNFYGVRMDSAGNLICIVAEPVKKGMHTIANFHLLPVST